MRRGFVCKINFKSTLYILWQEMSRIKFVVKFKHKTSIILQSTQNWKPGKHYRLYSYCPQKLEIPVYVMCIFP